MGPSNEPLVQKVSESRRCGAIGAPNHGLDRPAAGVGAVAMVAAGTASSPTSARPAGHPRSLGRHDAISHKLRVARAATVTVFALVAQLIVSLTSAACRTQLEGLPELEDASKSTSPD